MNIPMVLDVCRRKSLLGRRFDVVNFEKISLVKIQENKKALKKFVCEYKEKSVLINNLAVNKPFLQGKIKPYYKIDCHVLPIIIDKICKSIINTFSYELPLEEVVIISKNDFAYSLVPSLTEISRMFTIVTKNENRQIADEIYFKYGCVIRHKTSMKELSEGEILILCCEDESLVGCENSVIINLTDAYKTGNHVLNLQDIAVYDRQFEKLIEHWCGVPGPEIYSLIDAFPDDNMYVEINRRTDRIFLLDTDAI